MINCSWRSLLQQYFCNKTVPALGQFYYKNISVTCHLSHQKFQVSIIAGNLSLSTFKDFPKTNQSNLLSACTKDSKLIWIAQQIFHCLKREHKAACFDPAGDGITLGYLNGNSSDDCWISKRIENDLHCSLATYQNSVMR